MQFMNQQKNSKDDFIQIPPQQLSKEWFNDAISELKQKNIFIMEQQNKRDGSSDQFPIKKILLDIKSSIFKYSQLKEEKFGYQFKKSSIGQVCKYYFKKCLSCFEGNQARENSQVELCLIDRQNSKDQQLSLEEISSYYVEIVNILIELVQNQEKLLNQMENKLQELQRERVVQVIKNSSSFEYKQKIMPQEEIKFYHDQKIVNLKINYKESMQLSTPRSPTILLISQRDTDKNFVMKSLFPQIQTQPLEKYYQQDLESFVIDTELFDFKQIDPREKQIKQYQKIFADNSNQCFCIWIVIKFERLDNMKDYFMQIYRYVKNLNISISMLITDFHLSDNIKQDEDDVRIIFQQYKLQELIFLGKYTSQEEMIQNLKKALPSFLKTKNTMFEEEDPIMQNQMLENLKKKFAIP